jgi:capsular polysaccharide transport system permease protein
MGMENSLHPQRSSLSITLSVWKALFLREALSRFFASRAAWFWLLLDPVFHVAYLMVIFTMLRVQSVGGIDFANWIMIGLLAFFMFRSTATQVTNSISANIALFAYRQVKPVDTALVRAALEGMMMVLVTLILLSGAGLLGLSVIPADPLAVLEALFGLWLAGIGFGLVASVANGLIKELGKIISLLMMPLYIVSGVMFPLSAIPEPYLSWLLLNPVAHGLEAARLGFVPNYHAVPGLSIGFLYGFALISIFLGLALQRRFALRLISQ